MHQMISRRSMLEMLRTQLENERSTFISHWQELANYVRPRRPRFAVSDVNKGDRRSQKIIDSTATLALRTLSAGMMGGITSPARPWFRLTTPDPELAEFGPVKEYLHDVTRRMSTMFLRSNLYNILPNTYSDCGLFGTGAQFLDEDFDTVIHNYQLPVGSYCIANDSKNRVRVFSREYRMTVRQLIEAFGKMVNGEPDWSNFSTMVQSCYERGHLETWVDVIQIIHPNPKYIPGNPHPKHKKFASVYYEKGSSSASTSYLTDSDMDRYLKDSGYDVFPVLAPRWDVTGEDVYGTSSPGMDTLGDVKALQLMQRRKAQAIEKLVNPALQGPPELRNQRVSILPGEMNYVASQQGMQGLRPVHEVDPRIQEIMLDIQDTRQTIQRGYYEDLFLMLARSDRREITAREIEERHEEKLLALGPVLEQLNQDLNDPLIDNSFHYMNKQGRLPPPPEELQGVDLKVEYVSVMAQAQKLVGIAGMERFLTGITNVAPVMPSILDKVNIDQWVDDYGDTLGINPNIVNTDEEVQATREARAQEAQKQQMMEAAPQMAQAAKNLAGAPMDQNTALTQLLGV